MNTVEELLQILIDSGQSVAVAESITAGHLQRLLTSISGASAVFKGGITAYQRQAKVELLDVDDTLAKQTDCVAEEIACQMALGALKRFHADYALATCGYAERANGAPFAFFAIAKAPEKIWFSTRIELSGSRIEAQKKAAQAVLEKFLDLLRNV